MAIDVVSPKRHNSTNNGTTTTTNGGSVEKPKLLHDSLHNIPQSIRFPLSGTLSNILFLYGFNTLVEIFDNPDTYNIPAARIYSIFYVCFIPIAHGLNSLLVFGWPTNNYIPSLLSNAPIGLTAMVIGTFCTGYFERIHLERSIDQFFINIGLVSSTNHPLDDDYESDFYCSLIVMAITGIWSYLLSVYVNSSTPSTSDSDKNKKKKEL